MSFIGLQRLAILKVSRDEIGRYVKFNATLSDGTLEFRCELGTNHIRKAVDTKYFDSRATEYHYDLILTYQINEMVDPDSSDLPYKGLIRCTQSDQSIWIIYKDVRGKHEIFYDVCIVTGSRFSHSFNTGKYRDRFMVFIYLWISMGY